MIELFVTSDKTITQVSYLFRKKSRNRIHLAQRHTIFLILS